MTDIFISYASADLPRVKPLVDALVQRGWSVWWDRSILAGKRFDEVIEAALNEARCVIVLWSKHSVQSDWVRTEAEEARQRRILVPARLDDAKIPLAFRGIQTANLVDWPAALPSAHFDELARAVSAVLSPAAPQVQDATTQPTRVEPAAQDKDRANATRKAEEERRAKEEEADRIAAQKAEEQRLARERAAVANKTEEERRAKEEEAERIAAQKAEEQRLARERAAVANKAQEERRAKEEEAERIAAQRAEEQRLVRERAAVANETEDIAPARRNRLILPASGLALALISGLVGYVATHPRAPNYLPGVQHRKNPKDGLTYVWIPPGKFTMGCSQRDTECLDNEKPSHPVNISKGFWMGETEVTQGAYEKVMGKSSSYFKGAQRPVEHVSWNEASEYCGKVALRLPTEAEWEYAARAGSEGARYGDLDKVAWYSENSGGVTSPVRSRQPSSWGLYDTLGNVWEWTADW